MLATQVKDFFHSHIFFLSNKTSFWKNKIAFSNFFCISFDSKSKKNVLSLTAVSSANRLT